MQYKKGFWYLINLYERDSIFKEPVIEIFVNIDQVMDMEKILVSTFYTYAVLDPLVCELVNNKPIILRPDIVENKLSEV